MNQVPDSSFAVSNGRYDDRRELWLTLDGSKKDEKWGIGMISHYYTYYGYYFYPYPASSINRSYAQGMQDVEKYRGFFDPKDKKADWLGISWDIVSPIPKIREVVIDRMMKVFSRFIATAIDPVAMNERNNDMLKLKFQKIVDEDLAQISAKLGMSKRPMKSGFDKQVLGRDVGTNMDSITNTYDLDLSNDDERQLYVDLFYKQSVEIAMELAMELFMQYNGAKEIIRKLCEDAFDMGVAGYRTYMDNITHLPTIRYVEPSKIGCATSARNDFRDVNIMWVEEWLTINDIAKMAGEDIEESRMIEMFNYAVTDQGFRDAAGSYLYWNMCTPRQREDFKIRSVYYEIKSINCSRYEQSESGDMYKRDFKYTPKKNSTGKLKDYYAEVIYKGYWQPMTSYGFGYGLLYNMNRDSVNKQRTEFSIYLQRFAYKSLCEQLIPMEDQLMLARLKLNHALIKSLPKGYLFNLKALANAVALGVAGYDSEEKLVDMFMQTGSGIFSPVNETGDYDQGNTQPVYPMENGLGAEAQGYLEIIAHNIMMMKEMSGINDAAQGSNPKTDTLVGLQKIALQGSYAVTQYMNDGLQSLLERGGKYLGKLVQYIVRDKDKNPFAYEFLISAIGKYNAAVIESMDMMPMSEFGITLEAIPTDEEIQFVKQILIEAFNNGQVNIDDVLLIAPIRNYKLASRLISIRARKMQKLKMQSEEANIKMQSDMQMAQNQIKIMIANIQKDSAAQKAQLEGMAQIVVAEMKTKGAWTGEAIKAQKEIDMMLKQHTQDIAELAMQHSHESDMQQQQPQPAQAGAV